MAPSRPVQGLLETRDCGTHRDARPPGQLDPGTVTYLGLLDPPGQPDPGAVGLLELLDPWVTWILDSQDSHNPVLSHAWGCQIPRTDGPWGVGHLRLPDP